MFEFSPRDFDPERHWTGPQEWLNLPIQHLPYNVPHSSYGFFPPEDRLQGFNVNPLQPMHHPWPGATNRGSLSNTTQNYVNNMQAITSTLFSPAPGYQPYRPDNTFNDLPGNYLNEASDSFYSSTLWKTVNYASDHASTFDASVLSAPNARENAEYLACNPGHGLARDETEWVLSLKISRVQIDVQQRLRDDYLARQSMRWQTLGPEYDYFELNNTNINAVADAAWPDADATLFQALKDDEPDESHNHDSSSTPTFDDDDENHNDGNHDDKNDDDEDDERLNEHNITTTWLSMPPKRQSTSGRYTAQATNNSFQDSAICMDRGYPTTALPYSQPATATNPEFGTSINATNLAAAANLNIDMARSPSVQRRISLLADPSEYGPVDWQPSKDAPYDLTGLGSSPIESCYTETSQILDSGSFSYDQGGAVSLEIATAHTARDSVDAALTPETLESNVGIQRQDIANPGPDALGIFNTESSAAGELDANTADVAFQHPTTYLAQNFEQSIQSAVTQATSAVNSITQALAQASPPKVLHSLPVALPSNNPEKENIEHIAPSSQATFNEAQPYFIRHASQEHLAPILRTPTPRRITSAHIENLTSASAADRTPEHGSDTEASRQSREISLDVNLSPSPTNETQREQYTDGQFLGQTFEQPLYRMNPYDNNSNSYTSSYGDSGNLYTSLYRSHGSTNVNNQFATTDPEDFGLSPTKANFLTTSGPAPTQSQLNITSAPAAACSNHYEPTTELPTSAFPNPHQTPSQLLPTPLPPTFTTPSNPPTPALAPFTPNTYTHPHPYQTHHLPPTTPDSPTPTSTHHIHSQIPQHKRHPPNTYASKSVKNVFASPRLGSRTPSPTKMREGLREGMRAPVAVMVPAEAVVVPAKRHASVEMGGEKKAKMG